MIMIMKWIGQYIKNISSPWKYFIDKSDLELVPDDNDVTFSIQL